MSDDNLLATVRELRELGASYVEVQGEKRAIKVLFSATPQIDPSIWLSEAMRPLTEEEEDKQFDLENYLSAKP